LNRNTIDNADCTMGDERMRITRDGYVGIGNTSPWTTLNLGNCAASIDPFINFGKNNGAGSYRNCKMGYNSGFTFCIGDFGNVNNNSNNWSQQFGIAYNAPQASLGIDHLKSFYA
jgi:hypothetical protein